MMHFTAGRFTLIKLHFSMTMIFKYIWDSYCRAAAINIFVIKVFFVVVNFMESDVDENKSLMGEMLGYKPT